MSILVFAAKRVGYECLHGLVTGGDYPITKIVVPGDDNNPISYPSGLAFRHAYGKDIVVDYYRPEIQDELAEQEWDWILNLWSPYILKKNLLDSANHRLNVHPSLIPFQRGMDQAAWTILESGASGVSLIEMEEEIDAGKIWVSKSFEYMSHWSGKELHEFLEQKSIDTFLEHWPEIYKKAEFEEHQPPVECLGSYHTRAETNKNRTRPRAEYYEAVRWIMAHNFYPGTMAEMKIRGKRYGLNLELVPLDE